MQLLIDYATVEGLKSLHGQVLTENATMLAMCRELGFRVKADPNEVGIARVSLDLAARSGSNGNATFLRQRARQAYRGEASVR
jgi:acetyltransferase